MAVVRAPVRSGGGIRSPETRKSRVMGVKGTGQRAEVRGGRVRLGLVRVVVRWRVGGERSGEAVQRVRKERRGMKKVVVGNEGMV